MGQSEHRDRDGHHSLPCARLAKANGVSGGHLAAAARAGTAGVDAFIHLAEALAFAGAVLTDLGTFRAEMLVVGRAQDHDVSAGPAGFRTGQHQLDMARSGMLAALLQAVSRDRTQADLVAAQAGVHAGLHVPIKLMHSDISSTAVRWTIVEETCVGPPSSPLQ